MIYNLLWVNLMFAFGLINLLFVPEKIVLAKSHVYVNSMLYIRVLYIGTLVITACQYKAIYHVYECDIAFIQQFDGTSA